MRGSPTPIGAAERAGNPRLTLLLSWVADVAVVVVFVATGRRSHDESAGGFFVTALPFLAALQTAWLATPRNSPMGIRSGLVVWGVTVVLGLVLRVLTGDSAAVGFIVVTTVSLGLGLLGWRAAVRAAGAVGRDRSRS